MPFLGLDDIEVQECGKSVQCNLQKGSEVQQGRVSSSQPATPTRASPTLDPGASRRVEGCIVASSRTQQSQLRRFGTVIKTTDKHVDHASDWHQVMHMGNGNGVWIWWNGELWWFPT